ncbi:hypothetical protein O181_100477 [Austropuccinia psidii MF-1]|uniref:Uncharacterized protein n=1 Tax=Austropuccinia psidii MF-1 TaxID=1389203 RepID=A0A9Q3JFA8_9BASI|nr:hypothetical protein [Austropuccinia psidii MF-1]
MQAEDSRRQNQSTPYQKKINLKEMGAITQLCPPQSLNSEGSRPLWGQMHHSGPPLQLWGGQDLDGLDPINGSWPCRVSFWFCANSWSHGTPGSPAKLGPWGLFWSWGPPIAPTDRGPRTPEDINGQKWPDIIKITKITKNPKKAQKAIKP